MELQCLAEGISSVRMASAREWEWKGFFPEFRNGLEEKDKTVTQYMIKVQCKGEEPAKP